jgi:hypothetical protein
VSSPFDQEVYYDVQATLLNSGCSPALAVQAALRAVAEFAMAETNLDPDNLVVLVKDACAEVQDGAGPA